MITVIASSLIPRVLPTSSSPLILAQGNPHFAQRSPVLSSEPEMLVPRRRCASVVSAVCFVSFALLSYYPL